MLRVLIAFLFLSSFAQAAEVKPWDRLNQALTIEASSKINGDTLMFVTHLSSRFDGSLDANKFIDGHVLKALKANIPVTYVLHSETTGDLVTYPLKYQPTYVFYSPSGSLIDWNGVKLNTKAGKYLLAGGYLELCLGETVRDVIVANTPSEKPIHLVLLSDSVFIFKTPSRHLYPKVPFAPRQNLAFVLNDMSDSEMLEYFRNEFFPDGILGQQNFTGLNFVSFESHTFRIFRGEIEIGRLGSGRQHVKLEFSVN